MTYTRTSAEGRVILIGGKRVYWVTKPIMLYTHYSVSPKPVRILAHGARYQGGHRQQDEAGVVDSGVPAELGHAQAVDGDPRRYRSDAIRGRGKPKRLQAQAQGRVFRGDSRRGVPRDSLGAANRRSP
mgnify:CR=1 FL=1